MDRKILFRKFEKDQDSDAYCYHEVGCEDDSCECVCENCMFPDEEDILGTMTSEELVDYACETFNVVLNKYKSPRTLAKEIMDLYEAVELQDEINKCNQKCVEVPEYAKNR